MFNKTLVAVEGAKHEHINITQQPHDAADAARLYGELEDKAAAKIVATALLKAEGFEVNAVAASYIKDVMVPETVVKVSFKLNGHIITVDMKAKEFMDSQAIIKMMSETISDKVMGFLSGKAEVQRLILNKKGAWL